MDILLIQIHYKSFKISQSMCIMMIHESYWLTVDAFTDKPFSGNPAAVMLLQDDIHDSIKQKIAAEMNISETAFVTKLSADDSFTESDRYLNILQRNGKQ